MSIKLELAARTESLNRVKLVGSLDTLATTEVQPEFIKQTVIPRLDTIVDLSRLDYMCSMGMGMLITAWKGLDAHGKKLILLAPQASVLSVLETSRLNEVFKIARDSAHAEILLKEKTKS